MPFVDATPYPWPYDGSLSPATTALVVIDMQTDFCGVGGYVDKMGYDISLTRAPIAPLLRALYVERLAVIQIREMGGPESPRSSAFLVLHGRSNHVGVHRHLIDADPHSVKNRIAKSRHDGQERALAHFFGAERAIGIRILHEIRVDVGHLEKRGALIFQHGRELVNEG